MRRLNMVRISNLWCLRGRILLATALILLPRHSWAVNDGPPCDSGVGGNSVASGVTAAIGHDPAKIAKAVTPEPQVEEEIVSFDPKDPKACDGLKLFLASHHINPTRKNVAPAIADGCKKLLGFKEKVTFLFFAEKADDKKPGDKKDADDDDKNSSDLTLSIGGEYHNGNDNYWAATTSVDYTKKWNDKHIMSYSLSGNIRTDQLDQALARASGQYMYIASPHWALFTLGQFDYNGPKKINAGVSPTSGVVYSVFKFDKRKDHYLGFGVGAGYRFDLLTDNSKINAAILSLRAKFSKAVGRNLLLSGSFFYQPSIYQEDPKGGSRVGNANDFRILAQAAASVRCIKKAKGFGASIRGEDEYFQTPPLPGTEKNDVRLFVTLDWTPSSSGKCDDSGGGIK
ncbi:MAG: DUF481 domain-containing protein, partial [Bdellovibrionota bacterium]